MKILVKSPLPGKIIGVKVSEGQEIKKGQVLVILESMKMHNEIASPYDGVVTKVFTFENDKPGKDTDLIELEKF
jgi:biotin carboxyl carrier protein